MEVVRPRSLPMMCILIVVQPPHPRCHAEMPQRFGQTSPPATHLPNLASSDSAKDHLLAIQQPNIASSGSAAQRPPQRFDGQASHDLAIQAQKMQTTSFRAWSVGMVVDLCVSACT